MLKIHEIDPNFLIHEIAPIPLEETILSKVESIWKEELIKKKDLTNGKIYSFVKLEKNNLIVKASEYRYYVARLKEPHLSKNGLDVYPLAVTGVLLCNGGLVLGRRSHDLQTDRGLWETAPAGSLSCPEPRKQILQELNEELGIDGSEITYCEAVALIEDTDTCVADIIYLLRTSLCETSITRLYNTSATKEYSEIKIIPYQFMSEFLNKNGDYVAPSMRTILELADIKSIK